MRSAILIVISLVCLPVRSQTVLSVGSVPGYPGGSVNVPVNLTRATNVVAAQFDVSFDPARVTAGPAIADPRQTILSREIAPGVRRVLVYSRQNTVVTNRTLVSLPFAVSPAEFTGSGPLTPANAILAQKSASSVTPLALSSGTIFVRAVNRLPDGHVQFFLPSTPDQRYYVQASTDLTSWVNISTNIATGSFLDLVDVDAAAYPYRFYRWQSAE